MGKLKVGLVSLGCSKNLVDSEVMLGFLAQAGFELTTEPGEADVLIVNTCGFIEPAKQESIESILQMAEYKKTGRCRVLAVTGCLSKRYSRELIEELPEVDVLAGVAEYPELPRLIREALQGGRQSMVTPEGFIYDETMPRIRATPPYMAYVKIAEGCANRCHYCAIPNIRGPLRSRTAESIGAEIRELVRQGVFEINLIAQDTSAYGLDLYGEPSLERLIRSVSAIDGLGWLRLFYAYPTRLTDGLLDAMAGSSHVCRYLDIPLQHAHPDVLARMGRPGGGDIYLAMIEKVRKRLSGAAIRSSFIVGYPGETEAEFEALLAFLKLAALDHVGVFKYSPEEGTPASELPDPVSEDIKQERFEKAMEAQREIAKRAWRGRVGADTDILITGKRGDGLWVGRTQWQGPEVDGFTFFEGLGGASGEVVQLKITGSSDYDLYGRQIGSHD